MDAKFSSYVHNILITVDIAAYSKSRYFFYRKHIIYDGPCISCTSHPMCLYGKEVLPGQHSTL